MIRVGIFALLFNLFNPQPTVIKELPLINWHEAKIFALPTQGDSTVENIVDNYLQDLSKNGYIPSQQGVWIQSQWATLGQHRGDIPASAASLTKIATTLASIHTWGLNHQFTTNFYSTGIINNGILNGDLIIESQGDPVLVWEEAIAMGNSLNELGIKQIKGNLIIVGDFMMNFNNDPLRSGETFLEALNSKQWIPNIEKQYQTLTPLPPRPQITITGNIKLESKMPSQAELLLTHQSLPMAEILRLMNVYSNNEIAEKLGQKIGGGAKVTEIITNLANVSPSEIKLINTSGLGVDNRISPHAVCKILITLDNQLQTTNIKISDLFPISNFGDQGTIKDRKIPQGLPVKTGTLAVVSALAGVIPTQERGNVCFTILNYGNNLDKMRFQQDILVQNLTNHWSYLPLQPSLNNNVFGDRQRNLITKK